MTSSYSRRAPLGAQPNWRLPTDRRRGSYYGAIECGMFNLTVETVLRVAAGLDAPAWEILRRADL
jgi:hypothetical protein